MTIPQDEAWRIAELKQADLFRCLTVQKLALLNAAGGWIEFRRGSMIEPPEWWEGNLCILTRGGVRVDLVTEAGEQPILAYRRGRGEIILLGQIDPEAPDDVVTGEALVDGTAVCLIPWRRVPRAVCGSEEGIEALGTLLRERVNELRVVVRDLSAPTGDARVRRVLKRLVRQHRRRVLDYKLEELAMLAHTSPSQVSRTIQALSEEGIVVRRSRGQIELADSDEFR